MNELYLPFFRGPRDLPQRCNDADVRVNSLCGVARLLSFFKHAVHLRREVACGRGRGGRISEAKHRGVSLIPLCRHEDLRCGRCRPQNGSRHWWWRHRDLPNLLKLFIEPGSSSGCDWDIGKRPLLINCRRNVSALDNSS